VKQKFKGGEYSCRHRGQETHLMKCEPTRETCNIDCLKYKKGKERKDGCYWCDGVGIGGDKDHVCPKCGQYYGIKQYC